tara:strand:+ start:123508 stop:124518 length:1011 start_codon:yes stop_codon:yes gene_type:complete
MKAPTPRFRDHQERSFTLKRYQYIAASFKERSMAGLLAAFISGDKRKVFPTIKKKFQAISLGHLFTPSGVHLASLYFLIRPLINRVRSKLFILIPLLGISYFFTPFQSIKRILLMKTTKAWLGDLNIFYIFLISFTWDFLLGTYNLSPRSFSYSFLFLGIILSFIGRGKIYLPLALFGGQIIAQYFSPYPLTTTGFIWNFLLTSIFGVLYPFFFVIYWFPTIPFGESLLRIFYFLVEFFSELSISLGTFMPTLNLILLSLYLSIGGRKALIIGLLLIFSSNPLFNMEINYLNKKSEKRTQYQFIEKTKKGYTSWHSDRKCLHRHNLTGMLIRCNYD